MALVSLIHFNKKDTANQHPTGGKILSVSVSLPLVSYRCSVSYRSSLTRQPLHHHPWRFCRCFSMSFRRLLSVWRTVCLCFHLTPIHPFLCPSSAHIRRTSLSPAAFNVVCIFISLSIFILLILYSPDRVGSDCLDSPQTGIRLNFGSLKSEAACQG